MKGLYPLSHFDFLNKIYIPPMNVHQLNPTNTHRLNPKTLNQKPLEKQLRTIGFQIKTRYLILPHLSYQTTLE